LLQSVRIERIDAVEVRREAHVAPLTPGIIRIRTGNAVITQRSPAIFTGDTLWTAGLGGEHVEVVQSAELIVASMPRGETIFTLDVIPFETLDAHSMNVLRLSVNFHKNGMIWIVDIRR